MVSTYGAPCISVSKLNVIQSHQEKTKGIVLCFQNVLDIKQIRNQSFKLIRNKGNSEGM